MQKPSDDALPGGEILIGITGAGVLALEVLASRMMTPYFGVSLFIWSGILSMTLTLLAVGYWSGGWWARRGDRSAVRFAFLGAPIVASVAVAVAALVYPLLFSTLARVDLVFGSFAASAILLSVPLIALSAMNPLLVALRRRKDSEERGDAGAGRIFFLSTMGSVAGVLITAFVFIPMLTNFRAFLLVGAILAVAALVMTAQSRGVEARRRRQLLAAGLVATAVCAGLAVWQASYLDLFEARDGSRYRVVASYGSMYGTIKVADAYPPDGAQPTMRIYLQDGLVQNRVRPDNVSLSLYTHMVEALALASAPKARDALVLGLGAGIVPRRLKCEGMAVTVIDINHQALAVANRHFGFDATDMTIITADARTYVRDCQSAQDLIIVDLFHGDNTPDYLMTREFFADLARCLRPQGALVMNAFFDRHDDAVNRRVLATVGASFRSLAELRSPTLSAFLVATNGPPPERLILPPDLPASVRPDFEQTMRTARLVPRSALSGSEPISDRGNIFSVLFARSEMELRQALSQGLPPAMLVN